MDMINLVIPGDLRRVPFSIKVGENITGNWSHSITIVLCSLDFSDSYGVGDTLGFLIQLPAFGKS